MPEARKIHRRIAVRNSPIHGRGVFALRKIPKGTRIIEYKGQLITDKEADRRYSRLHENSPHTMLFSIEGGLVIDATRRGNSARWINYSCAPNCEIEEEWHRVFIDARRDTGPRNRHRPGLDTAKSIEPFFQWHRADQVSDLEYKLLLD